MTFRSDTSLKRSCGPRVLGGFGVFAALVAVGACGPEARNPGVGGGPRSDASVSRPDAVGPTNDAPSPDVGSEERRDSAASPGLDAAASRDMNVSAMDTASPPDSPAPPPDVVVRPPDAQAADTAAVVNGLKGEYFDRADFTDLKLTRVDPTIDFDWKVGAPDPSMQPESFSVRWTGKIKPAFSEAYTFFGESDDGIRIWIGETQVLNNWVPQAVKEVPGTPITLQAGMSYNIRIEYYDGEKDAVVRVRWQSTSQSKQLIPSSALSPN